MAWCLVVSCSAASPLSLLFSTWAAGQQACSSQASTSMGDLHSVQTPECARNLRIATVALKPHVTRTHLSHVLLQHIHALAVLLPRLCQPTCDLPQRVQPLPRGLQGFSGFL